MRVQALIKRILLQLLRDKRTLALLFIAPLVILSLLYVLFNGETVQPRIGYYKVDETIVEVLKDAELNLITLNSIDTDQFETEDLDAIFSCDLTTCDLKLENSDPNVSKMIGMKINQMISSMNVMNANKSSQMTLETSYLYGDESTTYFDVLNPILIGIFVFFFVFLISGIGLLRERTTGTLERLMSTPINKGEVVFGYLIGYGIFAVVQTLIIVFFSIYVLDIVLVGSIYHVILVNLTTALVALSLGILLSTFANTEFQMIQFIPLVIVPQIFFSGIFPLEGLPTWVQGVAQLMPVYHVADALKGVMYKGYGLMEIMSHLIILNSFIVLFIVLNILALRKYRK